MKTETAKKEFGKLTDKFHKDKDVYCLVHFSRQDDYYEGIDNMDSGDALIVVKELMKKHGLSSEVIAAMNINTI